LRIQCLYRRPRQVFLVLLVIAAAACTTQPDYTGTVNSDDEPFISGTYAGIREPSATPVFKVTDEATLTIEIRIPEGLEEQSAPTVVFFFGGGWTRGNQSHFSRQAE
jgi:acetyl esterase/lipase